MSAVNGVPNPAPGPETFHYMPDERAPEVPRNTRRNSLVTPSRLAPRLDLLRYPPHRGGVLQQLPTDGN
ncbi:hypothetical protein F1880_010005 [Penicillium rolfsii]|nr:hypothetical protein F1880_010005 [Penicillium rolfsii]